MKFDALQNATLEWRADGLPYSSTFEDIYFSSENAIEETEHVFLQGNQLAQRFSQQPKSFVIAECGFGSGLNFLSTWKLWSKTSKKDDCLHYISCEQFPLRSEDLERIHALWPEFEPFSRPLRDSYIDHTAGLHRLHLGSPDQPVILDILYGDACEQFSSLADSKTAYVDAWFLDGFAPRINSAMWSTELFSVIKRLSHSTTTLATYSVAGQVRRELETAGFSYEKVSGYGNKRHMLRAKSSTQEKHKTSITKQEDKNNPTVTVIGGGLAGCSTAFALARKGLKVTLVERHSDVAQEASGNPKGVMFLPLHREANLNAAFLLQAYLYASKHYQNLSLLYPDIKWQNVGALQLSKKNSEDFFERVITNPLYCSSLVNHINAEQATKIAGIPIYQDALHLPLSAFLNPAALCKAYCYHSNISLLRSTQAISVNPIDGGWQVFDDNKRVISTSENLVVANGLDALRLFPQQDYPLIPNRGQLSYLQKNSGTEALKAILCGKGYITPEQNGLHACGGSFHAGRDDKDVLNKDHSNNLELLDTLTPYLGLHLTSDSVIGGRAAARCTTRDYFPLAGLINSISQDSLYLLTGLGSHGITTSPILAETIASKINQETSPIIKEIENILSPERFERRRSEPTRNRAQRKDKFKKEEL